MAGALTENLDNKVTFLGQLPLSSLAPIVFLLLKAWIAANTLDRGLSWREWVPDCYDAGEDIDEVHDTFDELNLQLGPRLLFDVFHSSSAAFR